MLPDGKMCPLVTRPSNMSGLKTLPVVIIGKPSPASTAVFSCAVVALDLLSLTSVPVPHVLTQSRNASLLFLHPFPDSQTCSNANRETSKSREK